MKIYILGASGFIGQHLLTDLSSNKQYEVIGLSSQKCNLLNPVEIKEQLHSADQESIIIFASVITRLKDNSSNALYKNIQMAENLCSFLKTQKIRQLIFFSTIDVYGLIDHDVVITEKTLADPSDNYSISKLTSEYLLKIASKELHIPLCILRLTGVYGNGDYGKSTINTLVESALKAKKINIFGTGLNLRDFVYVGDLSKIMLSAIEQKSNATFNIATGKSETILDISKFILKETDNSQDNIDFKSGGNSSRVQHLKFNTDSLKKSFPEIKMTCVEEGIRKYLRNYHISKI